MLDERQVKFIVRDELEKSLTERECPVCKLDVTMVKVTTYKEDKEGGKFISGWKCMKCNTLFKETLVKAE